VLQRLFEGRAVQYPYIFMTLQTLASNSESYMTNLMARRGIMIARGETQGQMVRMMPSNFTLEVEFVTNKFQGLEQGSVLAFARRWLFARRCGYLKFNIKYGRLDLWIASTLSDDVVIPSLENKVETETAYKTTSTMVVHGYISEPDLGSQGIVNDIQVTTLVGPDGKVPGSQFFAF
jgi:hypothetical protein